MGRIYTPDERRAATREGEIPESLGSVASPGHLALLDPAPEAWRERRDGDARGLLFSPRSPMVFLSRGWFDGGPTEWHGMASFPHRLLINSLEDAATILEVIRLIEPALTRGRA